MAMDDEALGKALARCSCWCGWRPGDLLARDRDHLHRPAAPGGWPQVGAIVAIMGVIDALFAPRLLKKAWDSRTRRTEGREALLEGGRGRAEAARRLGRRARRPAGATPARRALAVPTEPLAEAIAEEWRARRRRRSARHAADRARQCRDRPRRARAGRRSPRDLARYAEATCLLSRRGPRALVERQERAGTAARLGAAALRRRFRRRPPGLIHVRSRRRRSSGWRMRSRRSIRSGWRACRRW
jgi:hypothetical protein